nr:hypothetical protein [Rhizobium leguminosarum]
MHRADTRIEHEAGGWKIDFIGDDGDAVSVKVVDEHAVSADEALESAKAVMVQLTAYGTRGGGHSLNSYDAVSNGNFDDENRFWTPGISCQSFGPAAPANGQIKGRGEIAPTFPTSSSKLISL